jgi:hypothetical protein
MWSRVCLSVLLWHWPGGSGGNCTVTVKCVGRLSNHTYLNRMRNTLFGYPFILIPFERVHYFQINYHEL